MFKFAQANTARTSVIALLTGTIVTLVCFAPSPAQAVCQDGCLTNANTAQGENALIANTTGFSNTAVGSFALSSNTTGNNNTAYGDEALTANTTGSLNTAFGFQSLAASTTGSGLTALGYQALTSNTTGLQNTAVGNAALAGNTSGLLNTAVGNDVLDNNIDGSNNTAIGGNALEFNISGGMNTAVGHFALRNTTGTNNTALGDSAGVNLTNGSNNIDIGNAGVAGDTGRIRIGTAGTHSQTFVAGIRGATVSGGIAVFVNANGKLGTNTSSRRFKDETKPMDKASEAILALNPVTFRYKADLDPEGIPQFGLVAEEVEKIHPDLVVRDEKGEVYTVRYEAVNAMLLNEFLKEHRKVEQHEATIAELRKEMATVNARLKDHETRIEKVGARLEASRPATQLADNE